MSLALFYSCQNIEPPAVTQVTPSVRSNTWSDEEMQPSPCVTNNSGEGEKRVTFDIQKDVLSPQQPQPSELVSNDSTTIIVSTDTIIPMQQR